MKKVLFALLLFGLFVPVGAMADKPLPPPQMSQFFSTVIELEDALGEEEWERGGASANELDQIIARIRPSLSEQVGEAFLGELGHALSSLKGAISKHDKAVSNRQLLKLQELLFKAMDAYLYLVHPAILVIDQYVDEAIEAAERSDYDRVLHELEEVESFVERASAQLRTKGAGAGMQQDFRLVIKDVKAAAAGRIVTEVEEELQLLKRISAAFVWMASR